MGTYLVIGGSGGIGLALAKQLYADGATVLATYNKHPVQNEGIEFIHFDALDMASPITFIPDSLDGIAYCPGTINLKPFERLKPQDFEDDFRLQVTGAIRVIQSALPALKKSGRGSVLLFSSVAVQTGLAYHTQVAASKGAIEGLCRAMAAEFAPSVRVNCLAPSLTDTPLAASLLNTDSKREANALRHPLKRIGTTADLANMAGFLLSEKAAWITGQVLHVDGGMSTLK
ncbi:MAG: SDR family oxidoreductase [Chitinophagaceae bacterium]|nr:MAG: SDR family oxidoreductase [Chitinophagaceae bacterium]